MSLPLIGAPAIVLSLDAESAATARASESKVTYHVFPISGLTLLGTTISEEKTSVTCASVASSGTSRTMTVFRSFNGSGKVGTPRDEVDVVCEDGDEGVDIVLVVATVADASVSFLLISLSNCASDCVGVEVGAGTGTDLGLIQRPSLLTVTIGLPCSAILRSCKLAGGARDSGMF